MRIVSDWPTSSGFKTVFTCKRCALDDRMRPWLEVGVLKDGRTLRVWCDRCNSPVADFDLKEKIDAATPSGGFW